MCRRGSKRATEFLLSSVARCLLSGCTLGPRQIDAGRMGYNEAVQRTIQEELLLSLVRLKYRKPTEFMTVAGVVAQYTWDGSAGFYSLRRGECSPESHVAPLISGLPLVAGVHWPRRRR